METTHDRAGEVLPPINSDGPLASTRATTWAAGAFARLQQLTQQLHDAYLQTTGGQSI